jgi:hypothetical protein
MCCILPLTLLGVNSLAFLDFSSSTKSFFLIIQAALFFYLVGRLIKTLKAEKWNKLEMVFSLMSLCLIIFSFYINFFQPFHSENQRLMKTRIERMISKKRFEININSNPVRLSVSE